MINEITFFCKVKISLHCDVLFLLQHCTWVTWPRDGVCQWWHDVSAWPLAVLSDVLCVSLHWCNLWSH